MTESSAGWNPDPFGRHELRYWDGSHWTDHVATGGQRAVDPASASPPDLTDLRPTTPQTQSGWHPDPLSRYELRYWNGSAWTEHVFSGGHQGIDPAIENPSVGMSEASAVPISTKAPTPETGHQAQKIQKQVQRLGLTDASGPPDPAIFNESVLVVNQKGKLLELRAEFAVHDRHGHQLAAVRGKRFSSRLQIVDISGRQLLELRREGSMLRSKVTVAGPTGAKIGRIVTSFSPSEIDRAFKLEGADKEPIGAVFAEDRHRLQQRKRHREFNVQDANGAAVAHISKTYAGVAKELLTKGDNYVVNIPGPLPDPLRSLSIAAVLVIDVVFHQM